MFRPSNQVRSEKWLEKKIITIKGNHVVEPSSNVFLFHLVWHPIWWGLHPTVKAVQSVGGGALRAEKPLRVTQSSADNLHPSDQTVTTWSYEMGLITAIKHKEGTVGETQYFMRRHSASKLKSTPTYSHKLTWPDRRDGDLRSLFSSQHLDSEWRPPCPD